MEKKYESLDNILQSINQEKIEIETMQGDLKSKSKGKIRRFFSSDYYEKQQFKLYRTEIKGKIKFRKASVKRKESYLDNLCTFDFNTVTNFIAQVLSIIENEKYESTDIELEDSFTTYVLVGKVFMPQTHTIDESVCLITTMENAKQISDLYDEEDISDSDDIENSIQDGKYILLPLDDEYTIFDYRTQQVPEKLTQAYPYLSDIVCYLINLRLTNPELSDSQVADLALQQIPEKYSELVKKKKNK